MAESFIVVRWTVVDEVEREVNSVGRRTVLGCLKM